MCKQSKSTVYKSLYHHHHRHNLCMIIVHCAHLGWKRLCLLQAKGSKKYHSRVEEPMKLKGGRSYPKLERQGMSPNPDTWRIDQLSHRERTMPKLINECNVFTTRQQNNKEQHFVPSSEGNSKRTVTRKKHKQAKFQSDELFG